MICINCHLPTTQIKALVVKGKVVNGCDQCLSGLVQGNELAAQNKRTHDRREHRKSNVQPVEQREFAEAYPEQARELYGDEQMRKLGH